MCVTKWACIKNNKRKKKKKNNTWGRGRGFTEGTTKHKVLKLLSCPFLGFEVLMLAGKYRWWRTEGKRKKGGRQGTKTESLSEDWSTGLRPADFLWVQTVMAVAAACGDFSARDQEDDEGGRRIERGRSQSSPAVFHLALCALLPRPWLGFFFFFFLFIINALGSSSWTPRAASSCWEARPLPTRSWGRSPRRTRTRRCLWSWCTVCCRTTGSWPGAAWSPSPSPGRALKKKQHVNRRVEKKLNKLPEATERRFRRALRTLRGSATSCSTLLLQQGVLPLQVVDVLLVCVVFSPHILDVLCGFV